MPTPTAHDFQTIDQVVNQIELDAALDRLRDTSVASVRAVIQAAASVAGLGQLALIAADIAEKLTLGLPDERGAEIVNACSAESQRLMAALGIEPSDEVR